MSAPESSKPWFARSKRPTGHARLRRLAAAMRHAVFPRGARIRPRLCLAVAAACDEDDHRLPDAAAASIELLHCASLVHDDLPCFDDADDPAGAAFGPHGVRREARRARRRCADRACLRDPGTGCVSSAAAVPGAPHGGPRGRRSHGDRRRPGLGVRSGSRSRALPPAEDRGAVRCGDRGRRCRRRCRAGTMARRRRDESARPTRSPTICAMRSPIPEEIGKPTGRDIALGRPSATTAFGIEGAVKRLETLVAEAIEAIPACPRAGDLRALIMLEAQRLMPKKFAQRAA